MSKNREAGETYISLPMSFTKGLLKQVIYNPAGAQRESRQYSVYERESILQWLQSPTSSEKNLRNASIYMYVSSMQYARLLQYYAGLAEWAYVISPFNFEPDKVKPDVFKKQYYKVAHKLELMKISSVMPSIFLIALREGAYYGVWRSSNTCAFLQKINPDYCQITSVSDGAFFYSVDMSQIAENKLELYPDEFTTMYHSYKKTGQKWQEVPEEISFCLKGDASITDYSIPTFAAMMPSLYTIGNAEGLQETSDELKNYKMIVGQVEVDDAGAPKMEFSEIKKYQQNIQDNVGDGVGVALSPFELKAFEFGERAGLSEMNTLSKAISNYWSAAGTSGLLHGMPNSTAGVTKLAIKNDETFVFAFMKQVENVFNRYLKNLPGMVKFKITFLPLTVFNKEEMIKAYKEGVAYGVGKSQYLATLGIPQHDVEGLAYLESKVLRYDQALTPLKNSHNAGAEELSGAGRPLEDEDDLDASGESTRANDTNANR